MVFLVSSTINCGAQGLEPLTMLERSWLRRSELSSSVEIINVI